MNPSRAMLVAALAVAALAVESSVAQATPPPLVLETVEEQVAAVGGEDFGTTYIYGPHPEEEQCWFGREGHLTHNNRPSDVESFTLETTQGCGFGGTATLIGGRLKSITLSGAGKITAAYSPKVAIKTGECVYETARAAVPLGIPGPSGGEGKVSFKLNASASGSGCAPKKQFLVQPQIRYKSTESSPEYYFLKVHF